MQDYHSVGEIFLDLSRCEQLQASAQKTKAVELRAKLHLDDDAGRIEALCKKRYGAFTVETGNKLCGEVCCHHDLSDYEAKRLPPNEFIRLTKELPALVPAAPQAVASEPFVPTPLQLAILSALKFQALKKDALAAKVCGGDDSRPYKSGGLNELRERSLVAHKPNVGYYRPDAPPPTSL